MGQRLQTSKCPSCSHLPPVLWVSPQLHPFLPILDSTCNCVIYSLEDSGRGKLSIRPDEAMAGKLNAWVLFFLDQVQENSMASKMSKGFGILEDQICLFMT